MPMNAQPLTKRLARETPSIQSLDRGLMILEAVAKASDPVTLGQLTDLLGIDRSSAFRLANTLKRRGYLAKPSGRKDYILGPAIWRLSRQHNWGDMLIEICHDQLRLLSRQTNETAHLAIQEGKHALFIDHAATNNMITVAGQTGELTPLYCTAHGKALLADHGPAELADLFGTELMRAYTEKTIITMAGLVKACAEIKSQGFATDDEELTEGIRCVAAPIRDKDGGIIGSIGISAPKSRFPKERYAVCAQQVCAVAMQVSGRLGS